MHHTRGMLGHQIFRLEHKWVWMPGDNATRYFTRMTLGSAPPLGSRAVDAFVRPATVSPGMAQAWFKHNVEEVGLLEHFLPALYAKETGRTA